MKRLLLSLLLVVMLLPAVTYGDEPAYIFKLSVNGRESCNALPGDTVTVTVTLHRTAGDEPMYAMQDEVTFDPSFFALQPDSLLLHSGVTSSVIPLRDGHQAVCLHFLSFGDGEAWAAETVVASFQLKVLSRSARAFCPSAASSSPPATAWSCSPSRRRTPPWRSPTSAM